VSLASDVGGDHRNDGIAWALAFDQQTYTQRAGAPLVERINLFSHMLADALALARKKEIAALDMSRLEALIKLIDGEPLAAGGSDGGLRNMYRVSMDVDPMYNYRARAEIEILLDQALRTLKEIIAKHNLTNQTIMALVSANKGIEPKLKEGGVDVSG
jgi:hypothetical protein